jgi:4-amino-4-deoxy-L-arabinose transferase-like glycosyltransferase
VRARLPDPQLAAILALASVLCLWGLTRSGYSNTYYAAAAKAATESWKALFFGSLDPGSFITVDKPPLSLWLMGLSGRVLGFSSFSMLLPQALCTIGSVALLHATVKRAFGARPAVLAALALAVTPVTVAVARVNNPDALLVLLLVASGWALMRAVESGRTKHLAWCGAFVGLAFMTKMLQGWMVVPALALTYLAAGPPALGTRIRQLLIAGATMLAVSAAWPLAVTLWPGSTPYIGGSEDGSVWNLIFGYNGFGRIFGEGGPSGGGGFGGATGIGRLFNSQVGGQIGWLLPLAAAGLIAGLWATRSAPRTDRARAGWILFGVWAAVHVIVFSFQRGIFHPYYVSALAPAVAALSGAGLAALVGWARTSWAGVLALEGAIASTAWLAVALLGRTPDFVPWLRTAVAILAAVAMFGAVALKVDGLLGRRALATTAIVGLLAVLAGPAAYSITTSGRALNGNNVSAGPAETSMSMGGGSTTDSTLISYLQAHQGSAKYLLAATGSQTTAPIILATGKAVVTIGGFNGQDPAPTLAQLQAMVAKGELHYVLLSTQGGGGPGGSSASSELATWVTAHGTEVSSISGLYRV